MLPLVTVCDQVWETAVVPLAMTTEVLLPVVIAWDNKVTELAKTRTKVKIAVRIFFLQTLYLTSLNIYISLCIK